MTAVQFYYQMDGTLIPPYYIGYIVRDMTIIELAPTITCLVLAGKVGSNMAAELGACDKKNTSMPWKLWGQHLSLPGHAQDCGGHHCNSHFGLCCRIGEHFGAYIASVPTGLFSTADYIKGIRSFFCALQCVYDVCQSRGFAYILTGVSCYQGYFVKGAASNSVKPAHALWCTAIF